MSVSSAKIMVMIDTTKYFAEKMKLMVAESE